MRPLPALTPLARRCICCLSAVQEAADLFGEGQGGAVFAATGLDSRLTVSILRTVRTPERTPRADPPAR